MGRKSTLLDTTLVVALQRNPGKIANHLIKEIPVVGLERATKTT
jgi:hypothetical protein